MSTVRDATREAAGSPNVHHRSAWPDVNGYQHNGNSEFRYHNMIQSGMRSSAVILEFITKSIVANSTIATIQSNRLRVSIDPEVGTGN